MAGLWKHYWRGMWASKRFHARLVDIFYRKLLLRSPDKSGHAHFTDALSQRRSSPENVLNAFLTSDEFYQHRAAFADHYFADRPNGFFSEVSQFGETSLLIRAMMDMACTNRVLVDVGVMGRWGSNSYDLLRWFGWRGLLVEANCQLIEPIKQEFGDLNYRIVNFAVSDHAGTATLHIGTNVGVSSLNESHARMFGPTKGRITVPMERLPTILAREDIPLRFDLLSIDIEGEDIKVLNDLIGSSPYRPNWIIFESGQVETYHPGALPLVAQFDADYELVGKTQSNLIFRNRSLRAILQGTFSG